jgi:tetratricopeptide (TPR) repeat protein
MTTSAMWQQLGNPSHWDPRVAIGILSLTVAITALWLNIRGRRQDRENRARDLVVRSRVIVAKVRNASWGNMGEIDRGAAFEAMSLAEEAVKLVPRNKEASCALAECVALTEPKRAKEIAEEVLSRDPDWHGAYCILSRLYLQLDELEDAQRAIAGAERTKAACAHLPYNTAVLRTKQGRDEEALLAMEEAVRREPDSQEVAADYGTALSKVGRLAEAASQFRRAITLGARVSGVYQNLGNVLAESDPAEALLHYKTAVKLNPSNVDALIIGGALLNNIAEDPVGAEEMFRRALEISPERTDALANLATVLRRQGRVDEARREYRKYRETAIRNGEELQTHLNDLES